MRVWIAPKSAHTHTHTYQRYRDFAFIFTFAIANKKLAFGHKFADYSSHKFALPIYQTMWRIACLLMLFLRFLYPFAFLCIDENEEEVVGQKTSLWQQLWHVSAAIRYRWRVRMRARVCVRVQVKVHTSSCNIINWLETSSHHAQMLLGYQGECLFCLYNGLKTTPSASFCFTFHFHWLLLLSSFSLSQMCCRVTKSQSRNRAETFCFGTLRSDFLLVANVPYLTRRVTNMFANRIGDFFLALCDR